MVDERVVVIVDDSPSIRETVTFILEMEGFKPRAAVNGREGLPLIEELRPKAVLLDCMMPEMDGFELARHIRTNPDLGGTRIIMLTAMGQKIDEETAAEAGVDHFMTKPFDHDCVVALLNEIFEAEA